MKEMQLHLNDPIVVLRYHDSMWFMEQYTFDQIIVGLNKSVTNIAWSTNNHILLNGFGMLIIESNTGRTLHVLRDHDSIFSHVDWSPDECKIVCGSSDSLVRIHDIKMNQTIRQLGPHLGSINAVSWSPDGTKVVSGSDGKTVRIWDVSTERNDT